ncbi:hypothetical protein ABEB36_009221 [Hypothenemus hampei]|uniref:Interleukin-1 beta n=1 Tax=Hypothenemus hampei TaxID=57062 RepID=A0ABD1EPI1_HYPHA
MSIVDLNISLKTVLRNQQISLQLLSNHSNVNTNICTEDRLKKCYDISIPLTNYEEFHIFELKNNVIMILRSCMYKDLCISKSFITMMQTFLHRDPAKRFTDSKQMPEKFIMSRTKFYECMKNVICEVRLAAKLTTDVKELITKLGRVLSNSRDWHNARVSQNQNSLTISNAINGQGGQEKENDSGMEELDINNILFLEC